MAKLGVYIAAHRNPIFLRHCLLQILQQSRLPDVLSIHVNNTPHDHLWAVGSLLGGLTTRGVDVRYQHTSVAIPMPRFFINALVELVAAGCDYIAKADYDDLFFEDHLDVLLGMIEGNKYTRVRWPEKLDYAMNINAQLLVMSHGGGYKHKDKIDFGIWNPTGAHPNNLIFSRAMAEEFLKALYDVKNLGLNDDKILAEQVLPKFKGKKYDINPTSCFVAHGGNASVAHWSYQPPMEVM